MTNSLARQASSDSSAAEASHPPPTPTDPLTRPLRPAFVAGALLFAASLGLAPIACVATADESGDEDEFAAAEMLTTREAVDPTKPVEGYGCELHGHTLDLGRVAVARGELLVEVRFVAGSSGVVHHERLEPVVELLRDGCAAPAPAVRGIVELGGQRSAVIHVPLAELPDGHLDLGLKVEGAETVVLLRKEGGRLVAESDAERYPDGNTEIGGVGRECGGAR
ncbi:MAG: hypothetical protein U0441_02035 [Polyangiaceae bacterium]